MRLILLPGFEPINEVWSLDVKKGFNSDFSSISVLEHKVDMSGIIDEDDLDLEVENLSSLVNSSDERFVVFAKTTGVLVVLKAIAQGLIEPRRCVFLQIPILRARINNLHIDDWLYRYETETLFLQRKDDSDFYFTNMQEYLMEKKISNHQLIELETLDFDLIEIKKYKNFVLDYLGEVKDERRILNRVASRNINLSEMK